MSNYKDFDEFFGELEQRPSIEIKMFNEIYHLPGELPAMTILEAYRAAKEGRSEISEAKQMEMAMTMLGEENVADWCSKGLTITQLTELMRWVLTQHQGDSSGSGKK